MFDPATGLLCFGKNSPSNQAVNPKSYLTKLSSNTKRRIMMEEPDEVTHCFKSVISNKSCLRGKNLDFIFAINLVSACCFKFFLLFSQSYHKLHNV